MSSPPTLRRSELYETTTASCPLEATTRLGLAVGQTERAPVMLVADAIQDASNRGDVILDGFGGAGTTVLAAERTGRQARLVEVEPRYVDVTIRRWQTLTGRKALCEATGVAFDTRGKFEPPAQKARTRKHKRSPA